jgi:hypothetical protein
MVPCTEIKEEDTGRASAKNEEEDKSIQNCGGKS